MSPSSSNGNGPVRPDTTADGTRANRPPRPSASPARGGGTALRRGRRGAAQRKAEEALRQEHDQVRRAVAQRFEAEQVGGRVLAGRRTSPSGSESTRKGASQTSTTTAGRRPWLGERPSRPRPTSQEAEDESPSIETQPLKAAHRRGGRAGRLPGPTTGTRRKASRSRPARPAQAGPRLRYVKSEDSSRRSETSPAGSSSSSSAASCRSPSFSWSSGPCRGRSRLAWRQGFRDVVCLARRRPRRGGRAVASGVRHPVRHRAAEGPRSLPEILRALEQADAVPALPRRRWRSTSKRSPQGGSVRGRRRPARPGRHYQALGLEGRRDLGVRQVKEAYPEDPGRQHGPPRPRHRRGRAKYRPWSPRRGPVPRD